MVLFIWYATFPKSTISSISRLVLVKKQLLNVYTVMNALDPIEKLYDLYSEGKKAPRIVEVIDNKLD